MSTETTAPKQDITPALISETSFNDQVTKVTDGLAKKTETKKQMAAKWRELVKFMHANEETNFSRSQTNSDNAYEWVNELEVYKPEKEVSELMQAIKAAYYDAPSYLSYFRGRADVCALIEKHAPGFTKLVQEAADYRNAGKRELDQEKTTALRAEATKLIDEYAVLEDELQAVEDSLVDVDKYIGTVEKIANIADIATRSTTKR